MNYAKCICTFIKIWNGIFLDVLLCNAGHYAMNRNTPQNPSLVAWFNQMFWFTVRRVLCTARPHQRHMLGLFESFFFKGKFTCLFRQPCLVVWTLFVAISIQWQGFKSAVTSLVSFTYNCSAQSDEVAIPIFHRPLTRHCHTWSSHMCPVKFHSYSE